MSKSPKELAYPNLVWPTVVAVKERGGSATIEEIEEGVARQMGLSDDLLSIPHVRGSRTSFQYRLAWVRTFLKKVGALENSERAVWSLTDIGERMSEHEARDVFRKVNAEKRRAERESNSDDDDEVSSASEGNELFWVDRLLDMLGSLTPDAFERLAQRLLREAGFTKVEVSGRSGDGGIDGIGVLRMNLVSFQVLFQCKRWKGSVGASVVRDFRGAMVGRADKGLVITTGTFTADARKEATRDGAPAIDLIDGEMLCLLLKERKLGVATHLVEQISLDEAFFRSI